MVGFRHGGTSKAALLALAFLFPFTAPLSAQEKGRTASPAPQASSTPVPAPAIDSIIRPAPDEHAAKTYARHFGIAESLAKRIVKAARAEGVELAVAFGLVRVESNFREKAVGSGGALGLTQVLHGTARSMEPGISREKVLDGDTNLRLGFRYLKGMLKAHDGDVEEALFAYKYGPVNLARLRRNGRDPGNYARMVLSLSDTTKVVGPGKRPFRRTKP